MKVSVSASSGLHDKYHGRVLEAGSPRSRFRLIGFLVKYSSYFADGRFLIRSSHDPSLMHACRERERGKERERGRVGTKKEGRREGERDGGGKRDLVFFLLKRH